MNNRGVESQKILYVITKGGWGGAQRYVFDLASDMKKRNYEVVVACGEPGELVNRCQETGIVTVTIPTLQRDISILKEWKSFFALLKLFHSEKPQIVHLNSSKIGGLGSFAARVAGVPNIIFTAHGWLFNEDRSIISKWVIKFLTWLTILFSHQVIVLSEKEKEQVDSWLGARKKIIVVSNGISPVTFKTREEARSLLLPERASLAVPWFGTIAELHKNKGLEYSIRALSELKNQNFVYVIIGEGEERQNLQKLIENLDLSSKVFLVGFQKEAASLLKAFDLFLFTSIKEGFPFALLEAALAKLPVIATTVGGIPELIEHEKSGLLATPKDPQLVASLIQQLLVDPIKAEALASNLHQKVSEKFSFAQTLEKTACVYLDEIR